MVTYRTTTVWKEEHIGELMCSNGARLSFSAPAHLYGKPNLLTPEDAFVGALNMCIQLMFLWSAEKLKIDLVSYACDAEGSVEERLDHTSFFKKIVLKPRIEVRGCRIDLVERALKLAEKYSLVAQSVRVELEIEPKISVVGPLR